MLRVQGGDRRAFDLIMHRYLSKIWRLAISVLKTEQDADDAVQDVFFKLWQSRESWDGNGDASFSTWLYKIALNKAIDIRRAKLRKNEMSGDAAPEQTAREDVYKILFRKELHNRLAELIQTLPAAQRRVMQLHYFRDMDVMEISEHLCSTEQSVRSLLKRGRKAMRAWAVKHPDLQLYQQRSELY